MKSWDLVPRAGTGSDSLALLLIDLSTESFEAEGRGINQFSRSIQDNSLVLMFDNDVLKSIYDHISREKILLSSLAHVPSSN